jgi:hypothetical protein
MVSTCNLRNSSSPSCILRDWRPVWVQDSSFSWASRWMAIDVAGSYREGLGAFLPD